MVLFGLTGVDVLLPDTLHATDELLVLSVLTGVDALPPIALLAAGTVVALFFLTEVDVLLPVALRAAVTLLVLFDLVEVEALSPANFLLRFPLACEDAAIARATSSWSIMLVCRFMMQVSDDRNGE